MRVATGANLPVSADVLPHTVASWWHGVSPTCGPAK
jgi:hypothetical protein